MPSKPPTIFVNPKLEFKFIIIFIIFSAIAYNPVSSRPSSGVDNPVHHTVPRENTDVPQQSEVISIHNQRSVPEVGISGVEIEDSYVKATDEEEYPGDSPRDDIVNINNGARKLDIRLPKSSHVKNGRKIIISEQLPPPGMKAEPEGNDSIPGPMLEPLPEVVNNTFAGENDDNSSITDENVIRLSKNNRESQEYDHVDRNRELRLNAIKELIQSYRSGAVGTDPKPTKLPIDVFETIVTKLNMSQPPPFDAYPMKRRSFHPSCSLPNNTDVEMWADTNSMNLLFNLTYSAPQNTTVTIIAATLRLYKFAQGNRTQAEPSCGPNIVSKPNTDPDVDGLLEPQRDSPIIPDIGLGILPPTPNPVPLQDDDKQIRVSVYWYTRSLKKNKVKRKLLDSRMLSVYGKDEWVELNVRHAARQWRQLGKNFGLVVEVENEDGELLKASDYFKAMNCSNEASTAKPLPGVLLQAVRSIIESNSNGGSGHDIAALFGGNTGFVYTTSNGGNSRNGGGGRKRDLGDEVPTGKFANSPFVYSFLFPVIDMCTVEIPAHEAANAAFLQQTQYILTQQLQACKNNNKQNYSDLLTEGTSTHTIVTHPMATDPRENESLIEGHENSGQNNISHVEHDGHKKDHRHHNHHTAHYNPLGEISLQDSAHKMRHSRHKHRPHNSNHEDSLKRRSNKDDDEEEDETEEIKEEMTLRDEFGRELRKKIFVKEVIHSSNHRDSLTQRESDR